MDTIVESSILIPDNIDVPKDGTNDSEHVLESNMLIHISRYSLSYL